MKSAAVIVVLALAVCVSAETAGQSGFQRRAWCRAGSKLRITVTSGSCSGVVSANCKAFSAAFGQWSKDAKEWIAGEKCQANTLEAYAKAHAAAAASVLVNSLVSVKCKGKGYACGYAVAKGSALAKSLARAQAQAFVDADPSGEHGGTFCDADVEALGEVYAQAAEKVRSAACASNWGSVTKFSSEYAKSIECAVVTAYVRAHAAYCDGKGGPFAAAKAESKCEGRGTSYKTCGGY